MPTLRFRCFDEIPPNDQEHVAFLRGRMRGQQEITGIFGAQAHWPWVRRATGLDDNGLWSCHAWDTHCDARSS